MKPKAVAGELGKDALKIDVATATADRSDADPRIARKHDASRLPHLDVVLVIADAPALNDRQPRQLRRERLQLEEVVDCLCLMDCDTEPVFLRTRGSHIQSCCEAKARLPISATYRRTCETYSRALVCHAP